MLRFEESPAGYLLYFVSIAVNFMVFIIRISAIEVQANAVNPTGASTESAMVIGPAAAVTSTTNLLAFAQHNGHIFNWHLNDSSKLFRLFFALPLSRHLLSIGFSPQYFFISVAIGERTSRTPVVSAIVCVSARESARTGMCGAKARIDEISMISDP